MELTKMSYTIVPNGVDHIYHINAIYCTLFGLIGMQQIMYYVCIC